MKKLIVIISIFCALNALAQIELRSNGQLYIGHQGDNVSGQLSDKQSTVKIWGQNQENGAGGRISFGDDINEKYSHVMIGEEGDKNSDRIWLHGSKGFIFTAADDMSDIIMQADSSNLIIKRVIGAYGMRYVVPVLPSSTLRSAQPDYSPMVASLQSFSYPVEQEFAVNERSAVASESVKYGITVETMKAAFPGLVSTDENGNTYIDYISLIPVLVKTVQELSSELAELKSEENSQIIKSRAKAGVEQLGNNTPFLGQNTPNPTSTSTTIAYCVGESATAASLNIYNLQGTQVESYTLNPYDVKGAVQISAGTLAPGMYLYTLIVDGAEIETKRMIITE
ncbi:MAG: T9SS type A sorting domain-containing protein [Muribaculaceae bacterium]|nr:T9SS type A sorting domain-containing protein [Muribaculaceae bacterium]